MPDPYASANPAMNPTAATADSTSVPVSVPVPVQSPIGSVPGEHLAEQGSMEMSAQIPLAVPPPSPVPPPFSVPPQQMPQPMPAPAPKPPAPAFSQEIPMTPAPLALEPEPFSGSATTGIENVTGTEAQIPVDILPVPPKSVPAITIMSSNTQAVWSARRTARFVHILLVGFFVFLAVALMAFWFAIGSPTSVEDMPFVDELLRSI